MASFGSEHQVSENKHVLSSCVEDDFIEFCYAFQFVFWSFFAWFYFLYIPRFLRIFIGFRLFYGVSPYFLGCPVTLSFSLFHFQSLDFRICLCKSVMRKVTWPARKFPVSPQRKNDLSSLNRSSIWSFSLRDVPSWEIGKGWKVVCWFDFNFLNLVLSYGLPDRLLNRIVFRLQRVHVVSLGHNLGLNWISVVFDGLPCPISRIHCLF